MYSRIVWGFLFIHEITGRYIKESVCSIGIISMVKRYRHLAMAV